MYRSNKRKWLYALKSQEAETIIDTDKADDLALLANTPALDESLLHSLEKAAGALAST